MSNSITKQQSMKLKAASLAAQFLLGLIPALCSAQDFSADVIYQATKKGAQSTTAGNPVHPPSKLYVSKDTIRLETRGFSGTILLANEAERTTVALFPAQKAYQRLPGGLSEYFRVEDAENACPYWQKATDQKIDCEKVGHEVVDGREAVKYRNKGAPETATSAVWIDPALKFVVKWENAGAGAELHNIAETVLAADLFTVPRDYESLKARKGKTKGFSKKSP